MFRLGIRLGVVAAVSVMLLTAGCSQAGFASATEALEAYVEGVATNDPEMLEAATGKPWALEDITAERKAQFGQEGTLTVVSVDAHVQRDVGPGGNQALATCLVKTNPPAPTDTGAGGSPIGLVLEEDRGKWTVVYSLPRK